MRHTSRHTMHLMLYKEIHQRYQRSKEGAGKVLPIHYRPRVLPRTQRQAAGRPRYRRNEIADHEDVMPVVVIRARDIRPSSTSQRAEDTYACHELGQSVALSWSRAVAEAVEKED